MMFKITLASLAGLLLTGCVAVVDQPYYYDPYPVRAPVVYRDPVIYAPSYVPPAPSRYYNIQPGVPFGPRYGGYYGAPRYRHPYRY